MKIRNGFVTNSSSSSFVIAKKYLDEDQIEAIREHSRLGEKLGIRWAGDSWNINENENFITGYTWMDNFDMCEFFEKIDINKHLVKWGEYEFDLDDMSVKDWRRLLYEN